MTISDAMNEYWSQQVARGIANKIKILLESKNDLLHNSNTCLTNNWEGFCVEVQAEQSTLDPDTAIQEIYSFFKRYYEALPKEEQLTVWIQTDTGQLWYADNEVSDSFEYDAAPRDFEDCITLLMGALIELANDFRNDNIMNFIEYDCNGIEEEDDDYEEEDEEYED